MIFGNFGGVKQQEMRQLKIIKIKQKAIKNIIQFNRIFSVEKIKFPSENSRGKKYIISYTAVDRLDEVGVGLFELFNNFFLLPT